MAKLTSNSHDCLIVFSCSDLKSCSFLQHVFVQEIINSKTDRDFPKLAAVTRGMRLGLPRALQSTPCSESPVAHGPG